MKSSSRRIAINMGGGYVPGLNSVITGAVLAASELGWEAVGIQDGFDGLWFPERYSEPGSLRSRPRSSANSLSDPARCWAPPRVPTRFGCVR